MPDQKLMTLRLDADRAAELETVARADEQSVSEVVRDAVEAYIRSRSADEDFQERLRARIAEDRRVAGRLLR